MKILHGLNFHRQINSMIQNLSWVMTNSLVIKFNIRYIMHSMMNPEFLSLTVSKIDFCPKIDV